MSGKKTIYQARGRQYNETETIEDERQGQKNTRETLVDLQFDCRHWQSQLLSWVLALDLVKAISDAKRPHGHYLRTQYGHMALPRPF
jgi:hypothetical protein